jgi:hypothetical protein
VEAFAIVYEKQKVGLVEGYNERIAPPLNPTNIKSPRGQSNESLAGRKRLKDYGRFWSLHLLWRFSDLGLLGPSSKHSNKILQREP